jgi:hypothetical protein
MKRRSKVRATAAKARRPKSARLKRQSVSKDVIGLAHAAGKEGEVAQLTRELGEAREQQAAASQVLQVISSSPRDLEPVFATMLEKAVRICDAKFGTIYGREGDALHIVARHNAPPALAAAIRRKNYRPGQKTPLGRMSATKQVVHVIDLAAEQSYIEEHDPGVAGEIPSSNAPR